MTNFFNIFVLMSTKRICKKIFSYWQPFWNKKGSKGPKRDHVYGFVIFYLILMIFFSFDSSLKKLLKYAYRFDIALTISEIKGI